MSDKNITSANAGPATVTGQWLKWPVTKVSKSFRVVVVEPQEYAPQQHAAIFNWALSRLVSPATAFLDVLDDKKHIPRREHFDLITFPEAFLPGHVLIETLQNLTQLDTLGCVHVGLRPSADPGCTHLFSSKEVEAIVSKLLENSSIAREDLLQIEDWIKRQPDSDHFNIGCIFSIDSMRRIRVCLHPKLVRSKFESSPISEENMKEGTLISVITLVPEDRAFLSVTIQPLLCSDALQLETSVPGQRPMELVNMRAQCFEEFPPDHVDIVSLATCTPQAESIAQKGEPYRQWHQQFRDTFVRTGKDADFTRHHFASFVLANFTNLPGAAGGLSGAYVPLKHPEKKHPAYVTTVSWGRSRTVPKGDFKWSDQASEAELHEWSSLGYMACLNPELDSTDSCAAMLSFSIERLPREVSQLRPSAGLTGFQFSSTDLDTITKVKLN